MNKYDPNDLMERMRGREPRTNYYDSVPREQRADIYYGTTQPDENGNRIVAEGGRRDTRDYAESISRLLPMAKGSAPMTREVMEKMFRGKSGAQRREERKAKKNAERAARHLEAEAKRAEARAAAEPKGAE